MALRYVRRFVREEDAATAVEYGVIAALIMVATTLAFESLGSDMNSLLLSVSNIMTNKTK